MVDRSARGVIHLRKTATPITETGSWIMAPEVAVSESMRTEAPVDRRGSESRLTVRSAIAMTIAIGLVSGYLDVLILVLKRFFLNPEGYYRIARDFLWSVPLEHLALLAIPGMAIAVLGRGRLSVRWGAWILATLGLWGALLRLPIYPACSLLAASGLGRLLAKAIVGDLAGARRLRYVPAGMIMILIASAAATTGWENIHEARAVAALSKPPRARNTLLIVWDTVRADHLGFVGYQRDNTPRLARFAARGVSYANAIAPAPWTFPSHSSFFTGQWPYRIDAQWKPRLDTPDPTLAEYLSARGYQTAGFVANTNCCTYESGMQRGFLHYEDYATDPLALFARTVPGGWLVERGLLLGGDRWRAKWIGLASRDASAIDDAFLAWVDRRRTDRPFFAFLNFFDAHDSFIPPPRFEGRFGIRPRTDRDHLVIRDYVGIEKTEISVRDLMMVRDCYDNCIAYLDEQLGRLLDELGRRKLLDETDVILTSDHGEAFAEHGVLGHSFSAMLEELRVPLVMVSRETPADRVVFHPVSLSDLPATVVDRLGLAEGSPFPGHSLTSTWKGSPADSAGVKVSPALSEQANRSARANGHPEPGPGGFDPGFQMSLVASAHHYIRNGEGKERLFDLRNDPMELHDIAGSAENGPLLQSLRAALLKILTESPGSVAVETAYLRDFRRTLEAQLAESPGSNPNRVAASLRGN